MIAIIPARKGSKGLKNKNILYIKNKPLIAHTIIAAKKSKYIKDIFVSTDCQIIAKISKKYGAKVPFFRPKRLAKDNSNVIDVYKYTIKKLEKIFNRKFESFISLLPTSPLRNEKDIDKAVKIFIEKKADSVISVTESPFPISWLLKINKDGKLKRLNNKNNGINNRQETRKNFVPNGAIYVFKTSKLLNYNNYYFKKTYPFIMPKNRSIDINDRFDFNLAQNIFINKK
jgi:CMP-N,N'-diacetyllegionaminic acid synthase